MMSQLLDKKWYGGLYHLHNTNDSWDNWITEFEPYYQYPAAIEEKIEKLFKNNVDHIYDKNVVDLACNLGYLSLVASDLGAKKVLGIEIRPKYIDTFYRVYEHWPKKNITLQLGNLEILSDYQNWLDDVDTILYAGHFYHTIRHQQIIKAFTDSSATCLILESIDQDLVKQEHTESSDDPLNGYIDEDTKLVPCGVLPVAETVNLLTDFNWSIKEVCFVDQCRPKRFIIVAIKGSKK